MSYEDIPVRSIKHLEARPAVVDGFKIRTVAEVLGGKDMVQDRHRHDFYFMLALKKGSGNHEIDFVPHAVTDNSIFVLRPGQVHRLDLKRRSQGYLMEFGKDLIHSQGKDSILRNSAGNFCQLKANISDKLQGILASMHEEYRDQNEGFLEIIRANLSIVLVELARQRQHRDANRDKRNDYAQERLYDFLELLEKDVQTHKQVSHYAEKLNLSPFQLNSITKTLLGKRAAELIDDHILLESRRYLLATSNQVNQIAYHLGFEDVSYFIRFFKKHTGFTPEMFRQNFR